VILWALACLASFALGWYVNARRGESISIENRRLTYQNKLLRQQVQDLAAGEPPTNGSRAIPHPHQIEPSQGTVP
jgi:hypothetical protein